MKTLVHMTSICSEAPSLKKKLLSTATTTLGHAWYFFSQPAYTTLIQTTKILSCFSFSKRKFQKKKNKYKLILNLKVETLKLTVCPAEQLYGQNRRSRKRVREFALLVSRFRRFLFLFFFSRNKQVEGEREIGLRK